MAHTVRRSSKLSKIEKEIAECRAKLAALEAEKQVQETFPDLVDPEFIRNLHEVLGPTLKSLHPAEMPMDGTVLLRFVGILDKLKGVVRTSFITADLPRHRDLLTSALMLRTQFVMLASIIQNFHATRELFKTTTDARHPLLTAIKTNPLAIAQPEVGAGPGSIALLRRFVNAVVDEGLTRPIPLGVDATTLAQQQILRKQVRLVKKQAVVVFALALQLADQVDGAKQA